MIGLGLFGSAIARTLAAAGHRVLAIDHRLDPVEAIGPDVDQAVQADATDRVALDALHISRYDIVFVTIGDLAASILSTLLLRELGTRRIFAKINSEQQGRILTRLGAEDVLFPERDMGERVARQVSLGAGVTMQVELGSDTALQEMRVPPALVGKTLAENDVRRRHNVTIVAVKQRQHAHDYASEALVSPPADTVLRADDLILVAGRNDDLQRLLER